MLESQELSLEQQYSLRAFEEHVKTLSHAEAIQSLIDLHRQMLLKENFYRRTYRINSPDSVDFVSRA